ncbi:MAG: cupin domain-containing protein [Pseudomonadota bacterium]
MPRINLADKLALVDTHWDPHVVGDYNDNEVMVVKFEGAFPFHAHAETDDFFMVLEGEMTMEYEDRPPEPVRAGEVVIVPKGVRHRPRAAREVKVMLIEPRGEPNVGDSGQSPAPKTRI